MPDPVETVELTFHCEYPPPTCERPPEETWTATAAFRPIETPGVPDELVVEAAAATCPGCGNIGSADQSALEARFKRATVFVRDPRVRPGSRSR